MDRFDSLEFDSRSGVREVRKEAERTRPSDGPSYYRAAREMRESGHFVTAAKLYRSCVGFNEHHYAAWIELVDCLVRSGDLDQAEAVSSHVLESYRQVRPLYAARALVLGHRGCIEEAWPMSDVSVEGGDRSWYARCVRGDLTLRSGSCRQAEAQELFEEALNLAERNWEAPFMCGLALLDAKLPALAAGYLAEAGHWDPQVPACWLFLGDAFQALRLYEQAAFYYDRVTELEPTNDLGVTRKKETIPHMYGLMRAFKQDSLWKRWDKEFKKLESR